MTLPDYLILLIVGGFILLTVWRVLIPAFMGMLRSFRDWRRAEGWVQKHKKWREFDRLKSKEGRFGKK